jgi:hypothetical protein
MTRPLINKQITELEQLFESSPQDLHQLQLLSIELKHRTRPRARELAQRVESAVANLQKGATTTESGSHPLLPATGIEKRPTRRVQATTAVQSSKTQLIKEFTLIQPIGTTPRPSAFLPELDRDLLLEVNVSDSRSKRFCVALTALIREMRQHGIGQQTFTLEDGTLLPELPDSSYEFEFAEESNLFEGAQVTLLISGRPVAGRLTSITPSRIVVTLSEDLGGAISKCDLRIDNTALLQALHDRLELIEQGEASGFRADFAERVLSDRGQTLQSETDVKWPWQHPPTQQQHRLLQVAFSNDITWLWGPPGTGKTDCLSALVKLLYDAEERVLICSNTNQAVDQLLLKLCRKLRHADDPALTNGRIVRVGRVQDDLDREFGDWILPDRITDRRSAELKSRQQELETRLAVLRFEVVESQKVVDRFKNLDEAKKADADARSLQNTAELRFQSSVKRLDVLRANQGILRDELLSIQQAGSFRRFFMRSQELVSAEITRLDIRVAEASSEKEAASQFLSKCCLVIEAALLELNKLEQDVNGEDLGWHRNRISSHSSNCKLLGEELSGIAEKLDDIRSTLIHEARVVGATVTRTYLRPSDFSGFDTVIVDEASMILLPAVFVTAGLATKRVVIAGDFQQLPPILQTNQQSIFDVLGHNAFAEAGVASPSAFVGLQPRRVMLTEQFRMNDELCKIVSATFYSNMLTSHPSANIPQFDEPKPLSSALTIVDTSRIWPFTCRDSGRSKFNLMHALAVRTLLVHLQKNFRLIDSSGKYRIGVCSPYSAQAQLIRRMIHSETSIRDTTRVATVHGF